MNTSHGMSIMEEQFTHLLFVVGLVLFGVGVIGVFSSTLSNTAQIVLSCVGIVLGGLFTWIADGINHNKQKVKSVE